VVGTPSGVPFTICLPGSGSLAVRELLLGVEIGLASDCETGFEEIGNPAGRAWTAEALIVLRGNLDSVSGFSNYIILTCSLSSSLSLGISCSRRERASALSLSFPGI
jgi:hypothetical protein